MAEMKEGKTVTAFRRGMRQMRMGDWPEAKARLMAALGINNRTSFINYADGKIQMTVDKYNAVAEVFSFYGIKDCWGK